MIFDTGDNLISSGQIAVDSNGNTILTVRIECRAGHFLGATSAANLTVEARKVGDAAWTNIESGQISLTTYAGTKQNFEIKLTSGFVAVVTRSAFDIKISL